MCLKNTLKINSAKKKKINSKNLSLSNYLKSKIINLIVLKAYLCILIMNEMHVYKFLQTKWVDYENDGMWILSVLQQMNLFSWKKLWEKYQTPNNVRIYSFESNCFPNIFQIGYRVVERKFRLRAILASQL